LRRVIELDGQPDLRERAPPAPPQSPMEAATGALADDLKLQAEHQKLQRQLDATKQQTLLLWYED
jgi:hypothetical protein